MMSEPEWRYNHHIQKHQHNNTKNNVHTALKVQKPLATAEEIATSLASHRQFAAPMIPLNNHHQAYQQDGLNAVSSNSGGGSPCKNVAAALSTGLNGVTTFAQSASSSNLLTFAAIPSRFAAHLPRKHQSQQSSDGAMTNGGGNLAAANTRKGSVTLTLSAVADGRNSGENGKCDGDVDNNLLDYTTSSSSNSGSGIDYKRRHRCTLPSITTTTTSKHARLSVLHKTPIPIPLLGICYIRVPPRTLTIRDGGIFAKMDDLPHTLLLLQTSPLL